MECECVRRYLGSKYTISSYYIDGVYVCDMLEPPDRGLDCAMSIQKLQKLKVHGNTAIPIGFYALDLNTVSPRFRLKPWAKEYGGIVPRLLAVPCFSGVLQHPGNKVEDTDACQLMGENKVVGQVINSVDTFHKLMNDYYLPAKARVESIIVNVRYK